MSIAVKGAELFGDNMVKVTINPCVECHQEHKVIMPFDAWVKWNDQGEFIQRAWPEGSNSDRELLISGTCSACFDKLFPPEEEEE